MAETDVFPDIGWDYPLDVPSIDGVLRQKAEDGSIQSRIQRPDVRLFDLVRRDATTDEREQVEAFHRRLQADFFRLDQKVWVKDGATFRTRSFPVVFAGPPQIGLAHHNTWPISVTLIEAVGKPLPAGNYPDPTLGYPSFFIEEDDPNRAVELRGTWTPVAQGLSHAGNHKFNVGTSSGANADAFQFIYAGYGFRVHSLKGPTLGIYELFLDEVSLGTVDLYNAILIAAAPLFTKLDVNLGIHRLELRSTNTKNAASSAFNIIADAIEVLE